MLIFVTANIFFQLNLVLYLSLAVAPVFVPDRSSHRRCSVKKGVLRNFAKFTGKHLCNFLKKETLAQVFSCEFCEIFKNIFFTSGRLLLPGLLWKYELNVKSSHWSCSVKNFANFTGKHLCWGLFLIGPSGLLFY